MRVKYFFAALAALFLSGAALSAQTPEEIVQKMIAEMDRGDTEGFSMDFNMKIPIVGTVYSHNMVLGDKMKTHQQRQIFHFLVRCHHKMDLRQPFRRDNHRKQNLLGKRQLGHKGL